MNQHQAPSWVAHIPTNYLYDGASDLAIEELDNGGDVLARYAQGLGIDQPLSESRPVRRQMETTHSALCAEC